jgi:hypothetical protein
MPLYASWELGSTRVNFLVDDLARRVVCLTASNTIINKLSELYGYHAIHGIVPTAHDRKFSVRDSWNWICTPNPPTRLLGASISLKRSPSSLTEEQIARYELVREKCGALLTLIKSLDARRRALWTDQPMQDLIYTAKYSEAREVLALSGEPVRVDYPFVSRHAEYRNCSLEEAAREIVFKHNLLKEKLADYEMARVSYTDRIMGANRTNALEEIVAEYHLNCPIVRPT